MKDRAGHILRLVAVSPDNELWRDLARFAAQSDDSRILADALKRLSGAGSPTWHIFYIDESELDWADSFADADKLAKQNGRELPSRCEWALAVLALRANPHPLTDIFDGRREWCFDDGWESTAKTGAAQAAATEHWVCGGYTETLLRSPRPVPSLPKDPERIEDLWTWLINPLVIQRRPGTFGDHQTGARTVLRIYPQTPP